MGDVSDWLFGSDDKFTKLENGTPEMQQFHSSILQQLKQMQGQGGGMNLANEYYNNLLKPGQEGFNQFAQPYMQQFQEQTMPGIAEQYAGKGALSSSGFGQALGGAASGLQSQLAQLFSQLQGGAAQQQYGQFNQMTNAGLNYQPFSYQQQQGSQGLVGSLANTALSSLMGPLANGGMEGIKSLFKGAATGKGGMATQGAMAGIYGQ